MTTTHNLDELRAEARRLDAELFVLVDYDAKREALGYDYASGQRHKQIVRVRRERDHARRLAEIWIDGQELLARPDDVVAALRRIAPPKVRRLRRELEEWPTRARQLALRAWKDTAREVRQLLSPIPPETAGAIAEALRRGREIDNPGHTITIEREPDGALDLDELLNPPTKEQA